MTVRELMRELRKMPKDAPVGVWSEHSETCGREVTTRTNRVFLYADSWITEMVLIEVAEDCCRFG